MIDFYKELQIESSWSLSEIQIYLSNNFQKWEGLALSRGDAKSIQMLDYAKQAQKVFANQQNREKYDRDLDLFLNPTSQSDTRLESCKKEYSKAKEAYKRNDLQLAKIALQASFSYRDNGITAPLVLAAATSLKLGEYSQALGYINQAIVENPKDIKNYYLKLNILVQDVISSSQNSYINHQDLANKQDVVFAYVSKYFEQDVSPKTTKEIVQLYDEQLKQINLLKVCMDMRSLRERIFTDYCDLALKTCNGQLYKHIYDIYKKYIYTGYAYETSSELLGFSKKILLTSPQETIALEFIRRYKEIRRNEELARMQEEERKRKEEEEFQKNINLKANLGKEIISLNGKLQIEYGKLDIVKDKKSKIKLLTPWTHIILSTELVGVGFIYIGSVFIWSIVFYNIYYRYDITRSPPLLAPICTHIAIEVVITLLNRQRRKEINRLEEEASDIEKRITLIARKRSDLRNQFIALDDIPYNGEDIGSDSYYY